MCFKGHIYVCLIVFLKKRKIIATSDPFLSLEGLCASNRATARIPTRCVSQSTSPMFCKTQGYPRTDEDICHRLESTTATRICMRTLMHNKQIKQLCSFWWQTCLFCSRKSLSTYQWVETGGGICLCVEVSILLSFCWRSLDFFDKLNEQRTALMASIRTWLLIPQLMLLVLIPLQHRT